jgi:hypothetical protein
LARSAWCCSWCCRSPRSVDFWTRSRHEPAGPLLTSLTLCPAAPSAPPPPPVHRPALLHAKADSPPLRHREARRIQDAEHPLKAYGKYLVYGSVRKRDRRYPHPTNGIKPNSPVGESTAGSPRSQRTGSIRSYHALVTDEVTGAISDCRLLIADLTVGNQALGQLPLDVAFCDIKS